MGAYLKTNVFPPCHSMCHQLSGLTLPHAVYGFSNWFIWPKIARDGDLLESVKLTFTKNDVQSVFIVEKDGVNLTQCERAVERVFSQGRQFRHFTHNRLSPSTSTFVPVLKMRPALHGRFSSSRYKPKTHAE